MPRTQPRRPRACSNSFVAGGREPGAGREPSTRSTLNRMSRRRHGCFTTVVQGIGCAAEMHRPSVVVRGHPLATKSHTVRVHRLVLWEKLDGQDAPCHWCQRPLVWRVSQGGDDTLVSDHLDGDILNNSPENLVPACRGCNGNRTQWKSPRPCEWCQELFLPARPESRHCSQSCAQRHRHVR